MLFDPPAIKEKKPLFTAVPAAIRAQLEELCGGEILSGDAAYGGLSSSAGFVLTLKSGEKFFAKGTHPLETAHGAANLMQEIRAYHAVPALVGVAPRFIGRVTDNIEQGWMLGVWEYVAHDPARFSLAKIKETLLRWQAARDVPLEDARAHNYIGFFFRDEKKWRRVRDEENVRNKFLSLFAHQEDGARWLDKNIGALCRLQAEAVHTDSVEGLLHGDLRLDNFLFAPDKTYAVDWPNACMGPLVFDRCFLGANLEALGLSKAEDWAEQEAGLAPMLGAISGYFADQAYRDIPAPMPRLRWMQKSMLLACLKALARLGIIESPPDMQGQMQR